MLSLVALLTLAVPVAPDCPPAPGVPATLMLGVGSQKVLTAPFSGPPRASPPGLVELQVLQPGTVLVVGKAAGVGELVLDRADAGEALRYRLRVISPDTGGMRVVELTKIFPCSSTLDLSFVNDKLVLDGKASSLEEWKAAARALKQYPHLVLLGRLDPEILSRTLSNANAALLAAGFAKLKFTLVGDRPLLEGEFPEGEGSKVKALEAHWRGELEAALWKPPIPKPDAG